MCNLDAEDATYIDDTLDDYIERYPVVDSAGYEPDEDDWTATYDLAAAAVDVLYELAAAAADDVDFVADGASFNLSQKQRQWLTLAERYRQQSQETLRHYPC